MIIKNCIVCSKTFTVYRYRKDTALFCSRICKGIKKRGEKTWNFDTAKKALYLEAIRQRKTSEYRQWHRKIFERDNYTCRFCNKRGGVLNADHIKPFANYPELRFDLNNGRTLCKSCHKKTPTYGFNRMKIIYGCL